MSNVTTTLTALYLQTWAQRKTRYIALPYTTLNEKFNVSENITLQDGEHPTLQYIAIGNGGMSSIGNSIATHLPTHASLYNHIPFVIRSLNNDLSRDERPKYRLRVKIKKNNIEYIAYYLKVLTPLTNSPTLVKINVVNNMAKGEIYTPSINDLSPVIPTDYNIHINSNTYLSVTDSILFKMTLEEIDEFNSAYRLLHGEDSIPHITELALCSGYDRIIVENINNIDTAYSESMVTQVNYFISERLNTTGLTAPISKLIEMGGMELFHYV